MVGDSVDLTLPISGRLPAIHMCIPQSPSQSRLRKCKSSYPLTKFSWRAVNFNQTEIITPQNNFRSTKLKGFNFINFVFTTKNIYSWNNIISVVNICKKMIKRITIVKACEIKRCGHYRKLNVCISVGGAWTFTNSIVTCWQSHPSQHFNIGPISIRHAFYIGPIS